MSDILSRVQILLDADTARFEQKMKAAPVVATQSFDKISARAKIMAGVVATAALAGAGAVIRYTQEQAKAAQELQRFAYLAQATLQEFQKMAVGAQMMGIEQDKLSDIMKDWNERFGDFLTSGAGPLVDFMEQVAVKTEGGAAGAQKLAKELSDLSGPESMGLFVKKMEEANLSQDQMSFLMESMASDSTQLLPIMKDNAEGMRLWGEAAEDAGIILDEKTIKSANQMQVQTKMLDMQVQGLKNQFTSALLPSLVDVADAFKTGDDKARGMADAGEVLGNVLRGVAAVAIGVYATINLVANSMAGVAKSANDSMEVANKAAENGGILNKLPGIKLLKGGLTFAVTARADNSGIGMAVKDNADVIEEAADSINSLFDKTVSDAVTKLAELQGQANKTTTAATQGAQDWIDKQNKATKAVKDTTAALKVQQAQARDSIAYDFLDDFAKFAEDFKRQVAEIEKAKFGADQSAYIAKAKARYEYEEEMYLRQITEEIKSFKWSEEQKLNYSFETQRIIVSESGKFNEELKALKLKALDEQYAIELRKTQWHALEMRQTLEDSISGLSGGADDIFAKATMSPQDYSKWAIENQHSNAQASLKNERVGVERDIMTSDVYSTDDDRYDALLKAHQEYRDGLYALDLQYDQQVKELAQSQHDAQMGIWQDLLTRTGTIFNDMAAMVKETSGESSAAYKAMFLVNQGISMAQALINTEVAATKAMAEGGMVAGIPMATAIRALGYTSVAMIAAQTIAGMAHDGIDNVPYEGTWLLDKGERVVDSRTNADLKSYLNNSSNSSNGDIIINNNGSNKVAATKGSDGKTYVTIDEVEQFVAQSMARPNSRISKAVGQNTTASRRR